MTGHPSLRETLQQYLSLRRALRFKLKTTGRLLGQFVDYLEAQRATTLTVERALAWATLPAGASTTWHAIRLSMVRGFAAYLHGLDATVTVPPADLLRHGNDRVTPYLYSDTEIRALITAASALRPAFRAATHQALIGLLAASGIRIGEAIALDTDDLDPADIPENQLLLAAGSRRAEPPRQPHRGGRRRRRYRRQRLPGRIHTAVIQPRPELRAEHLPLHHRHQEPARGQAPIPLLDRTD